MPEPDNGATPSETAAAEKLKNDAAALEDQLKKERQERMAQNAELNKLREENKKREEADAEAAKKKLEEDGELKTLIEQERERGERLEKELADRDLSATLATANAEILGKYPKAVQKIAQTAGMTLTDDSDEAKTALTEKLDSIAKDLSSQQKVRGNNMPPEETPVAPERAAALKKLKFGDKSQENWHELLKDNPGIASMKKLYENAQP